MKCNDFNGIQKRTLIWEECSMPTEQLAFLSLIYDTPNKHKDVILEGINYVPTVEFPNENEELNTPLQWLFRIPECEDSWIKALLQFTQLEFDDKKVKIDLSIKDKEGETVWDYIKQLGKQSYIDLIVDYAKRSHQNIPSDFLSH